MKIFILFMFFLFNVTNAQVTCDENVNCCLTANPTYAPTITGTLLYYGSSSIQVQTSSITYTTTTETNVCPTFIVRSNTPSPETYISISPSSALFQHSTSARLGSGPTAGVTATPTSVAAVAATITDTCSTLCNRISSGTISDTASTSVTYTTPTFVVQSSPTVVFINCSPTSCTVNNPTLFNVGSTTAPSTSTDLRLNGVAWQAWSAWEYTADQLLDFVPFRTFPWSTKYPTATASPGATKSPTTAAPFQLTNINSYLPPSPSGLSIDLADCITAVPASSCSFSPYPTPPSPTPNPYQSLGNDCIGLPRGYVYQIRATIVLGGASNYHVDAIKADDCGNLNFAVAYPPSPTESGILNHNFIWSIPSSFPTSRRYFFFRDWSPSSPTIQATAYGGLNKIDVRAIGKAN